MRIKDDVNEEKKGRKKDLELGVSDEVDDLAGETDVVKALALESNHVGVS